MGTAAAIFNHAMTAGRALNGTTASPMANATPQATGTNDTGSSDSTSSSSATISANDFLTLLVTEMQNQDPTANTDPNEYINQLVQVNSLEQLISINQTLSGDVGGTSSGSGSSGQVAAAPQDASGSKSVDGNCIGACWRRSAGGRVLGQQRSRYRKRAIQPCYEPRSRQSRSALGECRGAEGRTRIRREGPFEALKRQRNCFAVISRALKPAEAI